MLMLSTTNRSLVYILTSPNKLVRSCRKEKKRTFVCVFRLTCYLKLILVQINQLVSREKRISLLLLRHKYPDCLLILTRQ